MIERINMAIDMYKPSQGKKEMQLLSLMYKAWTLFVLYLIIYSRRAKNRTLQDI